MNNCHCHTCDDGRLPCPSSCPEWIDPNETAEQREIRHEERADAENARALAAGW